MKIKKYKAVIMDFDLTIADTAPLIEECLYTNALRFGYDLDRRILREGTGATAESIYLNAGVDFAAVCTGALSAKGFAEKWRKEYLSRFRRTLPRADK